MAEPEAPLVDWDLRCRPTLAAVAPRLLPSWRGYFRIGEDGSRDVATNATSSSEWGGVLPGTLYDRPGEDPIAAALREPAEVAPALDAHGVERALLNPGIAPNLAGLASPRWAADLGRAVNDWMLEEWLPADPRLLASIVVATRNATIAAEEVRRVGGRERVAQVVVGYPAALLGDRAMHPLYAALSELGLPLLVQAGGAYTGASGGLTAVGEPASAFEAQAGWVHAAQAHIASLVARGTFDRFPDLRLVFSGFGAAWLPSLLWSLDQAYEAGEARSPARVEAPPSSLLRERIRFATAGIELPGRPERLFELLRLVDPDGGLLLFGSGRGGLDDSATATLLGALPQAWRAGVRSGNADTLLGARTIA